MFETAEERVKLLKMGLSQKEIEMLYIEHNNFKIIRTPILYDTNEFDPVDAFLFDHVSDPGCDGRGLTCACEDPLGGLGVFD